MSYSNDTMILISPNIHNIIHLWDYEILYEFH